MDVKAGKSKLQAQRRAQVLSSNNARRQTLGSNSTRDYTGVEHLNAPSPYTLLVTAIASLLSKSMQPTVPRVGHFLLMVAYSYLMNS